CREGSLLTAVTACTVIGGSVLVLAGGEPELGEMAGVLVAESHCGIARLVEGICLPALAGAKGQVARQQVVVLDDLGGVFKELVVPQLRLDIREVARVLVNHRDVARLLAAVEEMRVKQRMPAVRRLLVGPLALFLPVGVETVFVR